MSAQDEDREVLLDHFDVVDGQQRLTRCALLLDRVYDRLEALNDSDVPSQRRRLLAAVVGGVRPPKLQSGADLQEYWHQVILDGQPLVDGAPLAAQRRLARAAEFSRSAWLLLSTGASATARSAGVPRMSLGPNGPAKRDLRPQRPLMPQDEAEETKQPANGGGEYI